MSPKIDRVKEAAANNDIDTLITLASSIPREELDVAIEEYERFYNRELSVSRDIQNIVAQSRIRRLRNKIPMHGSYTYELE